MGRFAKKKIVESVEGVELNVMPFIDIFSLLCTFLLFSAVFVSIGIHTVQIPFLTNAAPSSSDDKKPKRIIQVHLDIEDSSMKLKTKWSQAPINKKTHEFSRTDEGLEKLHRKLIEIRAKNIDSDKITIYNEDHLIYDDLIKILDAIRLRDPKDPPLVNSDGKGVGLFSKVVLGSILL